ncbi:MAG: TlpA family protein disulfide reductase [Gammaproteobacteria bacterium]|nr:TlpA family protein disulfide reductase [Gammaproteobacteria bacterium]
MRFKDILIGSFVLSLVAGLTYVWMTPAGTQRSPDIALTTVDDQNLRLASFSGRPLLVTFWATTCDTCIKEMPELVALHQELSPRGLAIIGIAMDYDPIDQIRQLLTQRHLPYLVTHDRDGSAAQAFGGIRGTPTSFIISPDGRIVQQITGEMNMNEVRQQLRVML